ncbi:serine hydrolase [Sphingomonas cavernae]|nr:serine hydrolase [Sphingomonas cavernae]
MAAFALVPSSLAAQQVTAVNPAASETLVEVIAAAAQSEVADKALPSVAIALVDRTGVIWSNAWGSADAGRKRRATADTVYRAGSVSKLFTDIAVMKLVEQGKLDLDAPVTRYLPDFRPHNPFGGAITLRQLMTHRSGLIREAPRGHYFDMHAKDEADAVASLNETTLVAAPGGITKYSNAGIAVVGEVVAHVTGQSFEKAVEALVLAPLGMRSSGFAATPFRDRIAHAEMASFDGSRFAAPALELGTPAAGSLYTTANDLGRFAAALLDRAVLGKPATQEEMWREQFPGTAGRRFGLGFALGALEGQRVVGHGGAVYGFATDLKLMPDAGIGVVVFSTVDAGPSAQRLGSFALRALLATRTGKPLPQWLKSEAVSPDEAKRLSGRFSDGTSSVWTRTFDGQLVLDAPELAGTVRKAGGRFYLDDAQLFSDKLAFAADGQWVELAGRRYTRTDWPEPPAPSSEFAPLIGEYGWPHNILRIYERDGKPFVRIEWTDWLPLTRVSTDVYAFPSDRGLYPLEQLRFERDSQGNAVAVSLGAIRFPRRDFGAEAEAAIRAAVQSNMTALRHEARRASPPVEPATRKAADLVSLTSVDPRVRLDVRYAGTNNFMGQPIYESAAAYLQRPAAESIGRIQRALAAQGYGLLIHDAYRPWYVTKIFWDATPPENRVFVADPARGSRHNRGAAVDLTMYDLTTGQPIVTTGRYDEFSSRSFTNYVGGSDHERWLREQLRSAMEGEGFTVYPQEWWHFDLVGWGDYPIGNASFEQLASQRGQPRK